MSSNIALSRHALPFDPVSLLKSRLLWAGALVVFVVLRFLYASGDMVFAGGGGPDDITRLEQVRELAAHGRWFDRTLAQIGAPEALLSHWSRLIDLPLMLLVQLFALVFELETAETIVRVIWPSALLFALAVFVLREAEREAGVIAAIAVVVLAANSAYATFQFNPGRIDHHNIQILGAVIGVMLLTRSFAAPRLGWWAGGFLGLSLAAGLEALLLLGAIVGVAALTSVFFDYMRAGLLRALAACSAVVTAAFFVTVPPGTWFSPACDELALNLVLLLGAGALVYGGLCRWFRQASSGVWLTGLGGGGALAIGAYLGVEPACVGGPFAFVDPTVNPIWLDKVVEVKSLWTYANVSPSGALSFLAFAALGCAALGRAYLQNRDAVSLFSFVAMVIATIYSCIYVKLMPYAMWLAIPAVAVAIARLPNMGEIPQRTVKIAAMVLANQSTMLVVTGMLVGLFSDVEATAKEKMTSSTKACHTREVHQALNGLRPGLIANELDLGPFIALNSHHRVVAAPYHRLDASIIAISALFRGSPAKAEEALRNLDADYVVVCRRSEKALARIDKGTLMHALQNDRPISFLERVAPGKGTSPVMVWRVK